MPNMAGLSNFFAGGLAVGGLFGGPGVGFAADQDEKEYQADGEREHDLCTREPHVQVGWGNGRRRFSHAEFQSRQRSLWVQRCGDPKSLEYTSTNANLGASAVFTSGFPYASFLLGSVDSLNASAITDTRLGRHGLGFFAQDNWKVSRKLTLEYGLRWDYSTLLQEEHGRMQSACFQCANPGLVPADSSTPLNGRGLREAVQQQLSVCATGRA